jgi:hypothetical protein
MEKTYQLDQRETQQLQQMEQERTQALAAIGALSLDMETAKKNLENTQSKQRAFLERAVMMRNIDQYTSARMQNGALVVSLPDQPPMTAESGPGFQMKPNGQITTIDAK